MKVEKINVKLIESDSVHTSVKTGRLKHVSAGTGRKTHFEQEEVLISKF